MSPLRIAALAALSLFAASRPLAAQLPAMANATGRYIDFSKDLADGDVAVVVGTLGKWKEGRRERLADGKLGGAGAVTSVSGTQYFKVPVQTTVQVRHTFEGKVDKLVLGFDVQLARLPDGKEQRQLMTANAAQLDEGTLAMFVVRAHTKGKGYDLVHVIPFDKTQDQQKDPEAGFVDTMHDYYVVNRYVADLEQALQKLDGAIDPKALDPKAVDPMAKEAAAKALRKLLDEKPELKQHDDDVLWTQHSGMLEQRARKHLEDAAPAKTDAPKPDGGK